MCKYTEVELACDQRCRTVLAHDQQCKVKEVFMKCKANHNHFMTAGQFPTNEKVIMIEIPTTAKGSHAWGHGTTMPLG